MTNDVNYFEIGSPDPEASKAFYGALFDWNVGKPSMPARYSMINEDQGGLWDTSAMGGRAGQSSTSRSRTCTPRSSGPKSSGATVVVPFVDNGRIEFAHLTDPLGNRFGIWRPKAAE